MRVTPAVRIMTNLIQEISLDRILFIDIPFGVILLERLNL